jgi:hypothetical protein
VKSYKYLVMFASFTLIAITFLVWSFVAFAARPVENTQPDLKSWSKIFPIADRFVLLADFNNQAVLDRETGLVWERSPAATNETWTSARNTCASKNIASRRGWRQASIVELMSLWDPSELVPTSVFIGVQSAFYWTATSDAANTNNGWRVNFGFGVAESNPKTDTGFAWCVRGPMNESLY